MGKHKTTKPPRPSRWKWTLAAALAALAVGGAAYWWTAEAPETAGGTPRLVLDREVLDFGYVPFEAPVRAVFTLSNAGDGVLRIADAPRVKVLAGC